MPHSLRDLSSPTRVPMQDPGGESRSGVLTTGPPGNSPSTFYYKQLFVLGIDHNCFSSREKHLLKTFLCPKQNLFALSSFLMLTCGFDVIRAHLLVISGTLVIISPSLSLLWTLWVYIWMAGCVGFYLKPAKQTQPE